MTIFDLVTANDLAAYWKVFLQERPPFLGDELFPANKKLGLDIKWIKGAKGLPIVLKPSAYDVAAVPRPRIAFERFTAQMPFFKESKYIDEELRQQLNMVIESGNQAYIDSIINNVFDDEMSLLDGAAARREQMRMSVLTSGAIAVSANGQNYTYDYGVPTAHKANVDTAWSDTGTATIVEDIRVGQDLIEDDTGERPTRAVVSRKTWGYMLNNEIIRKSIYMFSDGRSTVSDTALKSYLMEQLELEVLVYSKRYVNDAGVSTRYVPDDTFTLFPAGALGTTWFGTTPEESDLMARVASNVAITDVGVAVATIAKEDPVNVDTKVTMICLPSFEMADHVYQLDLTKA